MNYLSKKQLEEELTKRVRHNKFFKCCMDGSKCGNKAVIAFLMPVNDILSEKEREKHTEGYHYRCLDHNKSENINGETTIDLVVMERRIIREIKKEMDKSPIKVEVIVK